MAYEVEVGAKAEQQLGDLDKAVGTAVERKIIWLAENAEVMIHRHLVGMPEELSGLCKTRVGDWRILYWIDHARKAVRVYRIQHRSEVYRRLKNTWTRTSRSYGSIKRTLSEFCAGCSVSKFCRWSLCIRRGGEVTGKNQETEADSIEGDENGERVPERTFTPVLMQFFPRRENVERRQQRGLVKTIHDVMRLDAVP